LPFVLFFLPFTAVVVLLTWWAVRARPPSSPPPRPWHSGVQEILDPAGARRSLTEPSPPPPCPRQATSASGKQHVLGLKHMLMYFW
jgi:hypothetical protein